MNDIDLSSLALPDAIEVLSFEDILSEIEGELVERFPPIEPILKTESAVAKKLIEAVAYRELGIRARVNDAIRGVLAPLASGSDLDAVVARQGVVRALVAPAGNGEPDIWESDAELLRRYYLSFSRASAGSIDRYLFEAWSAWPAMLDARVNGHRIHSRPGDVDIVILGPNGRMATAAEQKVVSEAVHAPNVKPEATSVSVIHAERREYDIDLHLEITNGPAGSIIIEGARKRIIAATSARMRIGGEIPAGFISGAAYGDNISRIIDRSPIVIERDPYAVPVMRGLNITFEVLA